MPDTEEFEEFSKEHSASKERRKPEHLKDCTHYWQLVDLQNELGKDAIQSQFKELDPAHKAALKFMKVFKANPPRSRWERPEGHPSIVRAD
ncbi:hypothetical protein [Synechococcus elongatus]|uniref:hypothetical protein n=1 Tax=Synechococcus elongatus TaxID=32046 RepID=UPI000F7E8C13|nr:hypothetical protein [Synechococcus elongatus]